MTNTISLQLRIENYINNVYDKKYFYILSSYIAKKLDCNIKEAELAISNSNAIRHSLMKTYNNENIYYRAGLINMIKDAWKTFQHINYLKYGV